MLSACVAGLTAFVSSIRSGTARVSPPCRVEMQLEQVTRTDPVAVCSSAPLRTVREWVCANCDDCEDADEKDDETGALAGADGEQNFLAELVFEFVEVQCRLTLIAQHLEHGRTVLI